jgi:hypothetical protein
MPIHAIFMRATLFSGIKLLIFAQNTILIILNDLALMLLCPAMLLPVLIMSFHHLQLNSGMPCLNKNRQNLSILA